VGVMVQFNFLFSPNSMHCNINFYIATTHGIECVTLYPEQKQVDHIKCNDIVGCLSYTPVYN
jgi:hypothetical protein